MADEILFHERQRFRQTWLWVLLACTAVPLVLLTFAAVWKQGLTGEGIVGIAVAVVAGPGSVALFYFARLDVDVTPREIAIRFTPFHRAPRRISLADVAVAKQRRYKPLDEYGGWGIRGIGSDIAYNVSGDDGVQLVLTSGKRILLGSQRASELEAAIDKARNAT